LLICLPSGNAKHLTQEMARRGRVVRSRLEQHAGREALPMVAVGMVEQDASPCVTHACLLRVQADLPE